MKGRCREMVLYSYVVLRGDESKVQSEDAVPLCSFEEESRVRCREKEREYR